MNSLSWMIYLADVFGTLINLCILALVGICGVLAVSCIVFAVEADQTPRDREANKDGPVRFFRAASRTALFSLVPVILLLVFLPSSKAIYAIAASEYGERLVDSPLGTKAEMALHNWIDEQLDGPKKP